MKPWPHGRAVVNGEVRYLSVSSLEKGDSCLRSWWLQYVGGHKPPETKAQAQGTELHAEIARYLQTGVKALGPLAMSGLHMIPDPGPDLIVEYDLLTRLDGKGTGLATAPLRAGGIPVLGQLDLAHSRGTNKGADDIQQAQDPQGTIEVLDWKSTSDFKWAKTRTELPKTIQMSGYGTWVLNQIPEAANIRLSHGYFLTRGRPQAKKVSVLVPAEEIRRSWEHADGVGRLIAGAAKERNQDSVAYNLRACDRYGGCPHRASGACKAGQDAMLAMFIGSTAASALRAPTPGVNIVPSLLQHAQNKSLFGGAAPAPAGPNPAAVAQERARLEAEDRQAKLKAKVPAGFEAECTEIRATNQGFPTLKGAYAHAYAAMGGQEISDERANAEGFPGTGVIGCVDLDGSDGRTLSALIAELRESPLMSPPIPPDAPISNPALAAKTEQTPTPIPPAAAAPTPQAADSPIASVVAEAKKRGRPTKVKDATPDTTNPPVATGAVTAVRSHALTAVTAGTTTDANAICLFIDCRPSVPHTDLYEWLASITNRLATQFNSVDIRCPDAESPLAYNKWEGALAAMVKSIEHAPLTGGYYYLDTRGSRIAEIAADALKQRCTDTGGFYARSAR